MMIPEPLPDSAFDFRGNEYPDDGLSAEDARYEMADSAYDGREG